MKFITRKISVARKILIILLVALILIFAITPNYSVQAVEVITEEDMPDAGGDIMGSLLKQIIQLIAAVGDIAMGVLNNFMLGADGFTSAMLPVENANINNSNSWLDATDVADADIDFKYEDGTMDTSEFFFWTGDTFNIPNFLYSPEAIFSNNIAALDVNFLNPNTYTAVSDTEHAGNASNSAASGKLREVIADWYISFRNIAIVGLLSVLVYLGIRILISSTAVDKAKYKESLQNWLVALCLVFFIHFIMSGLLMITDQFTNLFSDTANSGITVQINSDSEGEIKFRTNLIGFVRFNAQSVSMYNTAAYTIMYIALVIYTYIFTFMYFKRFLYMAFFTMIAPLVALTYPIDKAGDGKAQAFNLWFKEYTMNLILQPVHLILYVALVSSAMNLVKQNILYGLVAIAFLIPAEKFIKKMFGMDKADSPSGFGSFAAGAATMSGLKNVASLIGGGKDKKSSGKDSSSSSTADSSNTRVRTQYRGFLSSFNNGNNSQQLPQGDNANQNQADMQRTRQQQATSPEHQRMLDDRDAWQSIVDNPNTSDLDREEAQQQIDFINDDMRNRGYLEQEEPTEQNQLNQLDQSLPDGSAEANGQQNIQAGNNNGIQVPERRADWRKKRAIRGAKKGLKYALKGAKIATQAAGILGGATVGLAAGLTTGDMSNTLTFMGAGAVAGRQIGKTVGNLPEAAWERKTTALDKVRDKQEEYQYNKDKDMYGVGYAAQKAAERQNEREQQRFLKDKNEQAKYEEMAGRIRATTKRDVSTEDLMKSAYDYKKAGITDEKQIETGLTLESKYGGVNGDRHDNMIDIVKMSNSYGKDYVIDEKKRNSMQEMIKANVNGEQNQNEVWKLYTEALDMKKIGERHPINNPSQQQVQASQSQQQGTSRTTTSQTQQQGTPRTATRQTRQQRSTREPRRPGRPPRNPQQPPTQS